MITDDEDLDNILTEIIDKYTMLPEKVTIPTSALLAGFCLVLGISISKKRRILKQRRKSKNENNS